MSRHEQSGMEHDERFRDSGTSGDEGEAPEVDIDDDGEPRPEFQHDARFRDTGADQSPAKETS